MESKQGDVGWIREVHVALAVCACSHAENSCPTRLLHPVTECPMPCASEMAFFRVIYVDFLRSGSASVGVTRVKAMTSEEQSKEGDSGLICVRACANKQRATWNERRSDGMKRGRRSKLPLGLPQSKPGGWWCWWSVGDRVATANSIITSTWLGLSSIYFVGVYARARTSMWARVSCWLHPPVWVYFALFIILRVSYGI